MTNSNTDRLAVSALMVLAMAVGPSPAADRNGRIAFVKGADVYATTPDGVIVQRLTKLEPGSFAERPSWEPDDEHILYTVKRSELPRQLWIMNENGSNQHRLLDDPAYSNTDGSFSWDGQVVIFSRCQPRPHGACSIYQVKIDGTGLSAITRFQSGVVDSSPGFSLDGRSIAFERRGPDGVPGIFLIGADGSNFRRLTRPGSAARHPSWSPDGSRIAVSCNCSPSVGASIWLIEREGGELRQLDGVHSTNEDSVIVDYLYPSWSPDGNFVAVEQRANGPDSNVVILNKAAAGTKNQRVKRLIVGSQPSWSQAP
jgi:TolB protein